MAESDFVNNQQEVEISIASILALGFNHIRNVIISLLIGAVSLGGWQFYKSFKSNVVPTVDTSDNQKQIELIDKQIAIYEQQAEELSYYNEKAPLMLIDSSQAIKTVVTYGIVSDNESFGEKGIAVSSSIVNMYISYFKTLDLQVLIKSSFPNVWLQEVVSLVPDTANNPFFQVIIYSDTQEKGEEIATIINSCLVEIQPTIAKLSYKHSLEEISRTQVVKNEKTIADKQAASINMLSDVLKNIEAAKAQKKELELKQPEQPVITLSKTDILKWTAIGAVLGLFLYCLYLLVAFISKMPITSSREVEERTSIAFFGSLFTKQNWNKKIASSLLNERVFKSAEDAVDFAAENIKNAVPAGQKVLLVSSLNLNENSPSLKYAMDAMQKSGCTVTFAGNALTSVAFISGLSKSDSIVLLEEKWKSQWVNVNSVLQIISRNHKQVAGFILG